MAREGVEGGVSLESTDFDRLCAHAGWAWWMTCRFKREVGAEVAKVEDDDEDMDAEYTQGEVVEALFSAPGTVETFYAASFQRMSRHGMYIVQWIGGGRAATTKSSRRSSSAARRESAPRKRRWWYRDVNDKSVVFKSLLRVPPDGLQHLVDRLLVQPHVCRGRHSAHWRFSN